MSNKKNGQDSVVVPAPEQGKQKYVFRLFISGVMQNSVQAIENIKNICNTDLKDRYKLEVIDIYQQPEQAVIEQIIVIPTLIIKFPLPERTIIGDLSDHQKVMEVLNIH
jgi:circadian clock protein KaiB